MRRTDWELRLAAVVQERLRAPFVWGQHDCVLFAADCIHAMTGADPVADLRGQWADRASAVRAIAQAGGLASAIAARGFVPAPGPLFAQRGDLVLHRRDGTDALAICTGPALAAPAEHGLLFVRLDEGVTAWRV